MGDFQTLAGRLLAGKGIGEMTMRDIEEYENEAKAATEMVRNAWIERQEQLEKENGVLQDKVIDLEYEIERISKERDEAKERYAALVETVGTRTDQAHKQYQAAVGNAATDPRD
jgi:chromosome segregation ATPase